MYALVTRTQDAWSAKRSGEMNKLNTDCLFETDNEFGFPEVESSGGFSCEDLVPFHLSKKPGKGDLSNAVHFFIDDYKFEQVWTRPSSYIRLFQAYGNIVSPTFSIWSNQPYALSLFNMYRSRWCTRFYQEHGVNVLVDARWSEEDSYPYAFSGIRRGSPVIVNTVGTRYLENRRMFQKGFEELLRVVEPRRLYVYGEYLPVAFEKYFDGVTYFDSFWKKRREGIARKGEERERAHFDQGKGDE